MHITENKYHSTIKSEFKELIHNIVYRSRSLFHVYTIHRLLSLGLLIDFQYKYLKQESSLDICIELDLKQYGKVQFSIDSDSNYGCVANKESLKVLKNFLDNFDTGLNDGNPKGK